MWGPNRGFKLKKIFDAGSLQRKSGWPGGLENPVYSIHNIQVIF